VHLSSDSVYAARCIPECYWVRSTPVLPLSSSKFTQFLRCSGYSHVNHGALQFMKALKHSIHRVFFALL
jgi:hypothetical protein